MPCSGAWRPDCAHLVMRSLRTIDSTTIPLFNQKGGTNINQPRSLACSSCGSASLGRHVTRMLNAAQHRSKDQVIPPRSPRPLAKPALHMPTRAFVPACASATVAQELMLWRCATCVVPRVLHLPQCSSVSNQALHVDFMHTAAF